VQGDWGTQFGMLIQHIDESRPGGLQAGGGTTVEAVGDLQELYKNSKKRFDEDEVFKKKARDSVKELQGGNPLYVQVRHHLVRQDSRSNSCIASCPQQVCLLSTPAIIDVSIFAPIWLIGSVDSGSPSAFHL